MKRTILLSVTVLLLLGGFSRAAEESLLRDSDIKTLSKMFSEYFAARMASDLRKMTKSFEDLEKKLESLAKSRKVETPLISPSELRQVFDYPVDEEKSPKKGAYYLKSFTIRVYNEDREFQYYLHVPRMYTHTKEAVPVILALHPDLDRDDEVKKWAQSAFPEALTELAMVIIPLNVGDKGANKIDWLEDDGRMLTFFSLRDVAMRYHIDRQKVFLDGQGARARAVTDYVCSFPGMFAGAILRNLDSAPASELLANARAVPFLLLSPGAGDGGTLISDFAGDAQAKGVSVELAETQFGEDGSPGEPGEAALLKLLTDVSKNSAPERITFTTVSPAYVNAYWFQLTLTTDVSPDDPVRVEAELNRAANEILVKTSKSLSEFTIYLNDDLLDMGKTIKVLHSVLGAEGAEPTVCFEGTKGRNLEAALNIWYDNLSGNFGEVYTNFIKVKLSQ